MGGAIGGGEMGRAKLALTPHSASLASQKPTKIGSTAWQRTLSTPNWKIDSTPCAVSISSSPNLCSEM